MGLSRYGRTGVIGGERLQTSETIKTLRSGIRNGTIKTVPYVTSGSERLDIIAAKKYGNFKLWWIIAAASGIGWALQVPPGTRLLIPTNLSQIAGFVR